MRSRSARPRVPGAPREHEMFVAQDDEFAHPGGWVVGVDGVGAGHVEDGLMGARDRPAQSLILAIVAGPNFSTVPNPVPPLLSVPSSPSRSVSDMCR